jgi:hypothetical protein
MSSQFWPMRRFPQLCEQDHLLPNCITLDENEIFIVLQRMCTVHICVCKTTIWELAFFIIQYLLLGLIEYIVTCQPFVGSRNRALLGSRQLNASRTTTRSAAVGKAVFAPCRALPCRAVPSAAAQQPRWRHMCLRGCQETSRHLVRLQGEWETWRNSTVERRNDRC